MASDRWRRVGPLAVGRGSADPRVRPAPLWAHWLTAGPRGSLTAISFEILGARPNFASKDIQNYFSKDFHARKYFFGLKKHKKC